MLITGVLFMGAVSLAMAAEIKDAPMSEEQKEVQARMQEYSTPNANHELLKSLAGSWKANVKFWMDPKGEPQESDGTSTSQMVLDGHFLEQTYKGSMMGKPFEGRGIYGYDNLRQEFTGLWLDNMATGIMVSAAKYDAATKTLTEEGAMSCPITNEAHRWYKAVTTIVDADNYTYESYMKDPEGKEFKGMIITYTRAK